MVSTDPKPKPKPKPKPTEKADHEQQRLSTDIAIVDLSAPFFVVFQHREGVKLATFVDVNPAKKFYDDLGSTTGAKVLLDRSKIEPDRVIKSNAPWLGGNFIGDCEKEIAQARGKKFEYSILSCSANGVRKAMFLDLSTAQYFYRQAADPKSSTVLVDLTQTKPHIIATQTGSLQHDPNLTAECISSALNNLTWQPYSLAEAPYAVGFHHSTVIRIAGCFDEESASRMFDCIHGFWAKVLVRRKHFEVLSASSGGNNEGIDECKSAVRKLGRMFQMMAE